MLRAICEAARGRWRQVRGDGGWAGPGWIIVSMVLLAALGLLVDGGGLLRASDRADAVAHEAARTGTQMIDPGQAISGEAIVLDPDAAASAAREYLAQAGVTGSVTVAEDASEMTVTVSTRYEPLMLSALGFGPMDVSGAGTAYLVHQTGD